MVALDRRFRTLTLWISLLVWTSLHGSRTSMSYWNAESLMRWSIYCANVQISYFMSGMAAAVRAMSRLGYGKHPSTNTNS